MYCAFPRYGHPLVFTYTTNKVMDGVKSCLCRFTPLVGFARGVAIKSVLGGMGHLNLFSECPFVMVIRGNGQCSWGLFSRKNRYTFPTGGELTFPRVSGGNRSPDSVLLFSRHEGDVQVFMK